MSRLPRKAPRERLAQLWYLARFWHPIWTFECCYLEDRRQGVPRGAALRNWLRDTLHSYWTAMRGY